MTYSSSNGPRGLGTFTDGASTVPDLNKLLSIIADVGNTRVGTAADRDAFPTAKRYTGLRWIDTDTDLEWTCSGTTWIVSGGRLVQSAVAASNGYSWDQNYLSRQGKRVQLQGYVSLGTGFGQGQVAGAIPAGFRPKGSYGTTSLQYTSGFGVIPDGFFEVLADGTVRVNLGGSGGVRFAHIIGSWDVA